MPRQEVGEHTADIPHSLCLCIGSTAVPQTAVRGVLLPGISGMTFTPEWDSGLS